MKIIARFETAWTTTYSHNKSHNKIKIKPVASKSHVLKTILVHGLQLHLLLHLVEQEERKMLVLLLYYS